jgi:anthranilate synthase/aminodeoxychorismate synthase-like glutamine amidotransferase
MRVLLIDHYDSFIDMIADYLQQLDCEVVIKKSDQLNEMTVAQLLPNKIVIGPGPGHPSDLDLVAVKIILASAITKNIPVLGICLGHQIIAEYFGAKVILASHIAHGVCSEILHDGDILFNNVANPFKATRYHSLIVDSGSLNNNTALVNTARTQAGEVMALRHKSLPIYGVQFHPESVMTDSGLQILANFINM